MTQNGTVQILWIFKGTFIYKTMMIRWMEKLIQMVCIAKILLSCIQVRNSLDITTKSQSAMRVIYLL